MSIFRKFTARKGGTSESAEYTRFQLMRFIEARHWQIDGTAVTDFCAFALTLSQDKSPIIFVRERAPDGEGPWRNSEWVAHPQKSLEIAEKNLREILQRSSGNEAFETKWKIDSSVATKKGLLRFPLQTDELSVWSYGFVEIDLDSDFYEWQTRQNSSEASHEDLIFSIGITIDQRLQGGWRPTTQAHWDWIAFYFSTVPIQAGYFGSFKYVLKTLTTYMEENSDSLARELYRRGCATLGWGYGNIDARSAVSGKQITLKRKDDSRVFAADDLSTDYMFQDKETGVMSYPRNAPLSMEYVSSLPGFLGRSLPSTATLQYLMRRGYRFIQSVDEDLCQVSFKAASLMQSLLRQGWNENCRAEKQLLTTRFCYEGSDLAQINASSRSVRLGQKKDRDHFLPKKNITKYSELLRVYEGNFREVDFPKGSKINPISANYFALCFKEARVDIPWSDSLALTLAESLNESLRIGAWNYLSLNPENFLFLQREVLAEILSESSIDVLKALIKIAKREITTGGYWYDNLINPMLHNWVINMASKKNLEERDFLIFSDLVVKQIRNFLLSYNYDYHYENDLSLLFKAIKFRARDEDVTLLEKFLQANVEWGRIGLLELPQLFGIERSEIFSVGLLEIDELLSGKLQKIMTQLFDSRIRNYFGLEDKLQVVETFLDSNSPFILEMIRELLPKFELELRTQVLRRWLRTDASGTLTISYTKKILSLDQEDRLLELLQLLGDADFDFFWRRSSDSFVSALADWVGFDQFLWSFVDSLPVNVLDMFFQNKEICRRFASYPSAKEIERMSNRQSDLYVRVLKSDKDLVLENSKVIGLTRAPNAELNQFGCDYIKNQKLMSKFWLYLLESNYPVCIREGSEYLGSRRAEKDFVPLLLAALDSDNNTARRFALTLVKEIRNVTMLNQVLLALLENRNPDTWPVVYKNLGLVKESKRVPEFTSAVFRTVLQGRREKEEMKEVVDELTGEIDKLVSEKTIYLMARSSVAKDRAWALRKIAQGEFAHKDFKVEQTWSNKNV